MPKKPMDYSNCIIYKIVCNDLSVTDCYVGHTTNFIQRKKEHKTRCINLNHPKNHYKIYSFINANGGWDNWTMIEIEKYSCKDFNEACARERYWYETLKANMNTQIPNQTEQEYKNKNRIKMCLYMNEYYINNKDKALNKINCICGGNYCFMGKARHFKTKKHQDFISSNSNKDKVNCICGSKYCFMGKARHFRTKKHQDFISSNSNKDAEKTTQIEEIINV